MSNERDYLTPDGEAPAPVGADYRPPPPPAEIPSRRVLRQAGQIPMPQPDGAAPEVPASAPVTAERPQILAVGEVAEQAGARSAASGVLAERVVGEERTAREVAPAPAVREVREAATEAAASGPVPSYPVQRVAHYPTASYPASQAPVASQAPAAHQQPAIYQQQPAYPGTQYPPNYSTQLHPNQPPMHYVSVPPRRHSVFPAALAAALIGALVASGITAAVMRVQGANTPQISLPMITNTDPGRVDDPLVTAAAGTQPAWQDVISSVQDSVVAIDAQTPAGGSVGSGFIIDNTGHVLTNNHVVAGAADNRVEVTLADGRLYLGEILGTDSVTDLALLQLLDVPADLHPVALGDSDQVRVGDAVLAVGNPLGLSNTATTGIVSALDRPVTAGGSGDLERVTTNAIQIDAAVNPGNSGGPVFDATGRVIGVTSSIASLQGGSNVGSIGLGFAIPINLVKNITEQLISSGSAEHALMGVMIEPGTATAQGVTRRGARVRSVNAGSPAEAAGVQAGDVIIAVNDRPVNSHESVTAIVREHRAGDVIKLTLVRNNQILELAVTLAAMPQQTQTAPAVTPELTEEEPEAIFPEDLAPPAELLPPTVEQD